MSLSDDDFAFYVAFLRKKSGYNLTPEKRYLLESRLSEFAKKNRYASLPELTATLRKTEMPDLVSGIIEAMTINETFFFRDRLPFDTYANEVLPRLKDASPARKFRIWSAACSTGQEPYSMAMIMENYAEKFPNITYEIVATDINKTVLEKARQGIYSDLEVHRGLNGEYRSKYFTQDGNKWHLSDKIKSRVSFRQLNLLDDYGLIGQFDFVLLRNVLIYFDNEIKEQIFKKVAAKMTSDGYLLLGAAEGIYDQDHMFHRCPVIQGLYKIRNKSAATLVAGSAN